MRNVLKRNQVMITALAIMIAVAGYLNFAGTKAEEEQLAGVDAGTAEDDMTALLDLSEEDIASDIESMDTDQDSVAAADYLDEQMILENRTSEDGQAAADTQAPADGQASADTQASEDMQIAVASQSLDEEAAEQSELPDTEVPGEAVFTSSSGISSLAGAKLQKEQIRAKNKETLMDIINNSNISDEQKQDAVNGMIELTDKAEREMAAEILLEAKGFSDVVVSISGTCVDVVVNASGLTDAQRAQIEDIVSRKTEIAPENIVISPVTGN